MTASIDDRDAGGGAIAAILPEATPMVAAREPAQRRDHLVFLVRGTVGIVTTIDDALDRSVVEKGRADPSYRLANLSRWASSVQKDIAALAPGADGGCLVDHARVARACRRSRPLERRTLAWRRTSRNSSRPLATVLCSSSTWSPN